MAKKKSLAPELYTNATSSVDLHYMNMMREQDKTPVPTDSSLPKIKLVCGPSPFTMPRGWEFFLTSPYEGITYIATVLHNAGYPVRIVDVRYAIDPLSTALQQVIRDTDLLAIATFEDNFPFVVNLIDQVKASRSDIRIVLGGSLVTSVPHVFFRESNCDVAVISEGEITILQLIESYARGNWERELSQINGIVYRDKQGQMLRTPARGQMMDLDSLPRMRLDLWPQSKSSMGLQPQIIASYSRGCKMDCSFCYRTTPQVRAKSPQKFHEDLTWLKEQYNSEFILFSDLTFTSEKNQTLEMCEVIKEHDLRWTCLTRCADVDPPRLRAMHEAGCDIALYGVESLGSEILKEARKGNSKNVTIRAMRNSWDAGVRFGALLIVGLPGESEESLNHACEWAEENNHVTRVKYLSAMPGTSIYREGIAEGMIRSEADHLKWLSIEQALYEDEFLNYNGLPEALLRRAYERIYNAYQPGPVMDFQHWPDNFRYFHPNDDDGQKRSTAYAGQQWRKQFSSAAPPLVPGSHQYTLDQVGTAKASDTGSKTIPCGAKHQLSTLIKARKAMRKSSVDKLSSQQTEKELLCPSK